MWCHLVTGPSRRHKRKIRGENKWHHWFSRHHIEKKRFKKSFVYFIAQSRTWGEINRQASLPISRYSSVWQLVFEVYSYLSVLACKTKFVQVYLHTCAVGIRTEIVKTYFFVVTAPLTTTLSLWYIEQNHNNTSPNSSWVSRWSVKIPWQRKITTNWLSTGSGSIMGLEIGESDLWLQLSLKSTHSCGV